MQIAFWSNMHGQGATTSNAVAVACTIAQISACKTLIAHNHVEKSAMEGYLLMKREKDAIRMLDYSNQGLDALMRLFRNGRLKPAMVPDYTYSLLKNHSLDLLFGSEKKDSLSSDSQDILLSIFEYAKEAYDIILLDLHSGLCDTTSRRLLETSDIVVFCLTQNRIVLDDFSAFSEEHPSILKKRTAVILSRHEEESSLSKRIIARSYHLREEALFTVPRCTGFMDACNGGRVFDYIAYGLQSRKGQADPFFREYARLSQYILEGCVLKA